MNNEELVRSYTACLEEILNGRYLENEFYDKSLEHKEKTINNLNLQKNHLLKYKKDFMAYFRKSYLLQCKLQEYPFGFSRSCAFIGTIATIMYLLLYRELYLHDSYNLTIYLWTYNLTNLS